VNIRVALTDRVSGFTHTVRTPRAGRFVFSFLPPGAYDLLAEGLGLLPVEVRDIAVTPAGDVDLEVVLAPVEPPVMERAVRAFGDRTDPSMAGAAWRMSSLELRRFADMRRDVTAAARFSTLADEALTMEGLPAPHGQMTVDGLVFGVSSHPLLGQTQAAGVAFPLMAFSEMVVDPGAVDIERTSFGSAYVSTLGVRGTNRMVARLFADWAPNALAGSKYFDASQVGGGSYRGGFLVSGPVIRDTAQFVLGVEASRTGVPLPPAWEPTDVDDAVAQVADSLGVDLGPYRAPRISTTSMAAVFGRFDWQANQQNRLGFLAFGSLASSDDPPLGIERAVGLGAGLTSRDLGLGATLTNVLSGKFALEMRLGFEMGRLEYTGNDTALTVIAGGPAVWGTDPALPGSFQRTVVRASETVHLTLGPHRLKVGGGGVFTSHRDTYAFGRGGMFVFGGPDEFSALTGGFAQTVGPEPIAKFNNYEVGWFAQDRWVAAPGAEIVLGVRMDWERADRGALLRNEQLFEAAGIATDSIKGTTIKVSPRVGFTWDLGNKHTWVVRATGGTYHGVVPSGAFAEAVAQSGAHELRYGSGPLGQWPDAPDSVAASLGGTVLAVLPHGFTAPRSTKATLGISGPLGGGAKLHLGVSYRHTRSLVRRRDLNRVPGLTGRDQYGRPLYGTLEQHGGALVAVPGSGRRLDDFSVVSALNQDGVSDYFGVAARAEKHVGRRLRFWAAYSISRTTDNVPGMALGPDAQLSPFPDSLNGVEWEEGVSDFDAPRRVVLGLELNLPAFRLAAFLGARSGRPFTPGFRDGVDANADGSWHNDPAFIDNQVPGFSELAAEWDCLRTQAGTFAERNSCRGPSLRTLDLRLALGPFRLGPGLPIEVVLDAMNLLDAEYADVDRALYLVDPTATLTTDPASGTVTVPLVVNQDFGTPVRRYGAGRYLRIGIRVNYE
jgi:hypothetical protein